MDALITVFYNYSGNDGDKYKLNKGELKELLNSELTDFLTVRSTFQHYAYFVLLSVYCVFKLKFGASCGIISRLTVVKLNRKRFILTVSNNFNYWECGAAEKCDLYISLYFLN